MIKLKEIEIEEMEAFEDFLHSRRFRKFMASWNDGYIGNICAENGEWWFMGGIKKYNSLKELANSTKGRSIVTLSEFV